VPRHVARLVTRFIAPLVVDYSASRNLFVDYSASHRLVVDNSASRRLVVDYFAYAARPGASARHAAHRLSSTTSPTPRIQVPRHIARPGTRLIVNYSVHHDFVLRPRWLYFSHAVRRDYLSRGNTGSTSSTLRSAMASSSGRITSTIHLD
jgi:hypothetical protein